jgi:long-chain acyl-CoA synthetase
MDFNYARYGEQNVEKFGEYVSLIYEEDGVEQHYTNTEIQRQSSALADGLVNLGIKKEEIVAVILPNGPMVPVVFMALFKIGAVFLPTNYGLAAHEIRYILEDSQAIAVITDDTVYLKVFEAARDLKDIRHMIVKGESPARDTLALEGIIFQGSGHFDRVSVEPDHLAVLMYTSGTTGFPKGVMLSHKNIGSNLEDGLMIWPHDPTYTIMTPLPLNHIYGLLMANECNITGSKLVLHKWFEPRQVLNSITRHRVTQFVGVPTMYIKMLECFDPAVHSTGSVKRWISAAAPLSIETLGLIEKKLGGSVFQGYGMTESSPTISRQREDLPRKPGSVGSAINGVEIRIVDQKDQELPAGQEGEVWVRGPNVMKGYLNKEEETRETLSGGWLHTGDMGYMDAEGDLFLTDRKKDLIIRGGENISPAAIENVLYEHPAILEAAVVGIPDPVYGEEVKAFVAFREGEKVSEQDLIEHCLRSIPRFKAPKSITFLDELPKSAVGKILKRELLKVI